MVDITSAPPTRQPRKPSTPFSFETAISQMFRSPDGREFGLRLWFWTAAFVTLGYLVGIPLIASDYFELMRLSADLQDPATVDEASAQLLGLFGRMIPGFLVVTFIPWFAVMAGEAALHRKILRGEERARQPLRWGRDEFRVLGAQLAVFGFMALIYFGAILLSIVTLGIGALIALPAALFLLVFVPLRLAPAAALSIKDRKLKVMEARRVTKHRAGPLFGTYLFLWFAGYVAIYAVMLSAMIAIAGDSGIAGMSVGAPASDAAMDSFAANLSNPLYMLIGIVAIIAYAAVSSLWYLSISGVGAYAVQWYDENTRAEVFS